MANPGSKRTAARAGAPGAGSAKRPVLAPSAASEEEEDDEENGGNEGEEEVETGAGGQDSGDDSDTSGTISEDLDLNKAHGSEDESEEESDDEDDEEDGEDGKVVTVDFDFKDPLPIDFLSLRNLLSRYLPATEGREEGEGKVEGEGEGKGKEEGEGDGEEEGEEGDGKGKSKGKRVKKTPATIVAAFNPSEIADAIIAQVQVGTTVKAGDDPDVYAFLTALNLQKHKVRGCCACGCMRIVVCVCRYCMRLSSSPCRDNCGVPVCMCV